MANSKELPKLSPDDLSRFQGYSWKRESLGYTTPCHIWTGGKFTQGYGLFVLEGNLKAHRVSWKIHYGEDPGGQLDHLCHDPATCLGGFSCPHRACVNPEHLVLVAARDNVLRGSGPSAINSRKTHCKHGHKFSAENTSVDSVGVRHCKQCQRDRANKYVEENREKVNAKKRARRVHIIYDSRPCPKCGKEYTPIRSTSTKCPDCRKNPTDYQREYMRAYRAAKRAKG